MRIDSHQHFTPEYSPALLHPILKRNRFEASVLVQRAEAAPSGGPPERTLLRPREVEACATFVRAWVVQADLSAPDLPHRLDQWQLDSKFRGVYGWPAEPGLAELARRDLTLDMPPRPDLVTAIAERFPDLRVVLDHVGRPSLMTAPFDEWARALEVAARHAPLCAKISGLITDAPTRWSAEQFRPVVRHALRVLGPGRLMFGSDWPSYLPEGTWKESLAAFTQAIGAMPAEMREHLLSTTAARFYRIDTEAAA